MLLVVAVLVVLAASVLLTNVFPYRKILAQQQQVSNAREQLEVLRNENDRLDVEVFALSTDAEVERLAREYPYVVLEPAATNVAPTVEPLELPVEPDAWYEGLWDFLTGKDLVDS